MAAQESIDQLIDFGLGDFLVECGGANRLGARNYVIAIEEQLAGWGEERARAFVLGALAGRIEGANRINFIAPELKPNGARELWREDVEDVAAYRNFPRFFDKRHALVAETDEAGDQDVAIDFLAD